ncbi:S8 family serine peptidase [Actinoplanes sp. CA-142083]|uniref:S8 family serine peptidase n=1 Tax=Actinoplanes sp. CA-142083 TaxID=3239903 RepID=UPI003D921588
MDPALWERLRAEEGAGEDRAIEAIIRLRRPDAEIPGVRMVARFGTIATCRIAPGDVVAVHDHPEVFSLKAARLVGPVRTAAGPPGSERLADLRRAAGPERPGDQRRPPGIGVTGAGVVVAALDWGADVDAAAFKRPPEAGGGTRFLALWDQRGDGDGPDPYGYGTVHDSAAIDAALRTPRPYESLGYHPGDADRGNGTHGTHVLDIAAGNGRGGGPAGLAPEAGLVFVHLADRDTGGLANLGDSVRLLEGVDFVRRTAGDRPWVLNVSVGRHGGPHDGTTLTELALDALLSEAPGRLVVQSTGNYYRARTHTAGVLRPGETHTFTFDSQAGDPTPNELEIWYAGTDELTVRIDPPGGAGGRPVRLGERAELTAGGRVIGRVYHRERDPNNRARHIDAFLDPTGLAGAWTVTLEARRVVDGRYDAWLERDDCKHCQARFATRDSVRHGTTGTIANGHLPLIVGAYDGHDPRRAPATFSSAGPTRDGRRKPDAAAPGVGVLAARSSAAGDERNGGLLVRKSGTSMAAPHVTGAVALCLELAGRRLTASQLREAVLDTCDATGAGDRLGRGCLNVPKLISRVRRLVAPGPEESTMSYLPAAPSITYRECLYRPGGPVARWVGERYDIVARPGHTPATAPRRGDLLLEVALGWPGPGRCVVLDEPPEAPDKRWPAGRLLLRPLPDAGERDRLPDGGGSDNPLIEEPTAEDANAPHVVAAREKWKRIFGGDEVLRKVEMLDIADVPSPAVRTADFDAWTNSATRIYLAPGAADDPLKLEVVLRHEAVHARQFRKTGRPKTYTRMMRYEREAYAEISQWLAQRAKKDHSEGLVALREAVDGQLKKFTDEIDRVRRTITDDNAINDAYKSFLTGGYLPAHAAIDDLYDPPAAPRESDDELVAEICGMDEVEEGDDEPAEFAGGEHKNIGDTASGKELTTIPYGDPPQQLTFGDVLSMAGDYFGTYEEMRDLGATAAGRAELTWTRWLCLDLERAGEPEPPAPEAAKKRAVDRYRELAARNVSHFSAGGTGWQAYSLWHARAITDALEAGRNGDDAIWRRALTKEAFGDHFLTDLFAAGHVRMPRAEIRAWYERRFPGTDRFVEYMARFLFDRLDERQQMPQLLWWFGWVTRSVMEDRIRALGGTAMSSFSLGDIVSLALHDLDNKGLAVISEVGPDGHPVPGGYSWTAMGDGHLGSNSQGITTNAMATAAVIGSLRDLERVRGAGVGQGAAPITTARKADLVRAALGPAGFAAKPFVPRADPRPGANTPLTTSDGSRAPLEWRWGQLGDAAYRAVDDTCKHRIANELAALTRTVKDRIDAPLGLRVNGVRGAFGAFVRSLRADGIVAIEKAVGHPAR